MSAPVQKSSIDLLLNVLTTTNALSPVVMAAIGTVIGIIKKGRKEGKTDAEIEAEAADSMATALRTRSKAEQQMGDQP